MAESFSMIAGGTIRPSRFVKLSTTEEGRVLEADAGEKTWGISQEGTRRSPYLGSTDAAHVDEPVQVYGMGMMCYLELGGTVTAGDRLKSDADGKGVTASADTEEYGAEAKQSGVSGELVKVFITRGTIAG